jgi:hypothetical protein
MQKYDLFLFQLFGIDCGIFRYWSMYSAYNMVQVMALGDYTQEEMPLIGILLSYSVGDDILVWRLQCSYFNQLKGY